MAHNGLPAFRPTKGERHWIESERRTAKLLRSLWDAAPDKVRRSGPFLELLTKLAWVNVTEDGRGVESTRRWRNERLARYLEIDSSDEGDIAAALGKQFPKLRSPGTLLNATTGITMYYAPLREPTNAYIRRHRQVIFRCCKWATSRLPREQMIERVFGELGPHMVQAPAGGKVPLLSGVTPMLACLSLGRALPIVNKRTRSLLRALGFRGDVDGALGLVGLLDSQDLADTFELDVYAASRTFRKPRRLRLRRAPIAAEAPGVRTAGQRSEETGTAALVARRIKIRHLHNALTNRAIRVLRWKYPVPPTEGRYDLFVEDWRPGRGLLIEAKTSTVGKAGRTQCRLAVGQLFDYRHTFFAAREHTVDLALLVPDKPPTDVLGLLKSLDIVALWFEGRTLKGTVRL